MSLAEFVPILQIAIGPVILISGIGLLLLSMTNRFGRIIDRSRVLALELRTATGRDRELMLSQITILSSRAVLVRQAIVLATVSVLCAAILVITLFLAAVFQWGTVIAVMVLFIACLGCLITALVMFLRDVNLSLVALKLELSSPHDSPGGAE